MTASEKIQIIGFGDDGWEGLTETAKRQIETAELLLGPQAALAIAPPSSAQRLEIGGDLEKIVQQVEQTPDRSVVILMLGDPLFYGSARYLCERLGKERFEVTPHVSSMQLAFARIKESWDEAYLANLASLGVEAVVEQIRGSEKAGLFTSEDATPAALAKALLERRIDYFTAYVCENLGSPDECVTRGELGEIAEQSFAPLNVMILVRHPNRPEQPLEKNRRRLFGNPDEAFLQSRPKRGLLTPAEVRCIALSELAISSESVVWDVGAGSGSVAIEAAQIAHRGQVFAIEMDIEDHQLISANAERFGVANLTPILGKAPEAWAELPPPDAVFVGGTGRQIPQIVSQVFERLKPGGRLAATVSSIENVAAMREVLQQKTQDDQVWMIQISRGVYQLENVRFESLNPLFLIGAVKSE